MVEFQQKEFTNQIITNLKNITGLNVYGSYPDGTSSFPLATVSIINMPVSFDIGHNEMNLSITCTVNLWSSRQTEATDFLTAIENNMIGYGFTRNTPTNIYKDNTVNKFTCSEMFRINYNRITGKFERSL